MSNIDQSLSSQLKQNRSSLNKPKSSLRSDQHLHSIIEWKQQPILNLNELFKLSKDNKACLPSSCKNISSLAKTMVDITKESSIKTSKALDYKNKFQRFNLSPRIKKAKEDIFVLLSGERIFHNKLPSNLMLYKGCVTTQSNQHDNKPKEYFSKQKSLYENAHCAIDKGSYKPLKSSYFEFQADCIQLKETSSPNKLRNSRDASNIKYHVLK